MAALGQHCPFCTALVWVAKDGTLWKNEEDAIEYEKHDDGRRDDYEPIHPDERERELEELKEG